MSNVLKVSLRTRHTVQPVEDVLRAILQAILGSIEIPLAGSPTIKSLSVKGLQAVTRGCAAVSLGASAQSLYGAVTVGCYASLTFVPIGVAGFVFFVAITPLIPEIEKYLSRVYKRALNPTGAK